MALSGLALSRPSRSPWLAAVILLAGCATGAVRPDAGASIGDYAANLNGKGFSLSLKPGPRTFLGLPLGITWLLDPVNEFCKAAGGQLKVAAETKIDSEPLPSELDCVKDRSTLWAFEPGYANAAVRSYAGVDRLAAVFHPVVLTADQVVARRTAEAAVAADKMRALEEQRRLAAEEGQRRYAQAVVEQAAAEKRAEVFRKTLQPGDRFQWSVPGRPITAVGLVVRVEGEMTFVQFDNLTMAGQATRYVPRRELRPLEKPVSSVRYDIN